MPWYFIDTILFFWLPAIFMFGYVYRRLTALQMRAFWINAAIWCVITFLFEYATLAMDIWNFSEVFSPLIGLYIWGVPIEEFLFWFGASFFFPILYLFLNELFPKKRKKRAQACPPAEESMA